jgi:hypothetical protein
MINFKSVLEYESELSKDEQINLLKKIICGMAGHGHAMNMIDNVYKEYIDMKDAIHSEA